jgi:multiple sugar transport system substrate-binding protein
MRAGMRPLATAGCLVAIAAVAVTVLVTPPAGAQEPIEIRFSWWGGQLRNEKTDKILQLFEAENPGVRVIRENSDWLPHWDKLTIQAAAGNQPCTIQMQTRWLATYAKPDILRPLDDLFDAGKLDVTGIDQTVIDSSRGDDGNLYMIPSGVFYFALMYNKTMLEDAGLETPAEDWSWSDFAQLVRDVAPKLPGDVNPTHNMGRETDSFVTWVQTQGYPVFEGSKLGFPEEVTARWFEFWEELRNEELTDSPEEMIADNGSLIEESNIANGRTFITNRPPNRLDSHQQVLDAVRPGEELTILPYPRAEDGTTGMDLGANGIAIGANCPEEKVPTAVAWINFFTQDPRAAAIYESDNGVVAVDKFQEEQANGPKTSRGQREQILLFQKVLSDAKPVNWPPGGYGAMTEALGRAYDAVAFETMSSEDAAAQFASDMEDLLN